MTKRLTIEALPAGNGDALWISYGDPPSQRHLLIDGGTEGTHDALKAKIASLPPEQQRLELLVISHVDGDHIAGALRYLRDDAPGDLELGDVWFNGWRHLPDTLERLGPVQGEQLTEWIANTEAPWNVAFGEHAVVTDARSDELLPTHILDGELSLTLLSPGWQQLVDLKPVWRKAVEEAGLVPGMPPPEPPQQPRRLERLGGAKLPDPEALAGTTFEPDSAEANGSSIVVLLEYDGKSVLLGADAHASVLQDGIQCLLDQRGSDRLKLDLFKVCHHGSRHNMPTELTDSLDCSRFLFSTNGSRSHHPHQEAVARVILGATKPATLYFNYPSDESKIWADQRLTGPYDYTAQYPTPDSAGIFLEV